MLAVLGSWLSRAYLFSVHIMMIYTKPMLVLGYFRRTKTLPGFVVPETLRDKYLWRKLFDRNPLYPVVSDKLACKKYVRERIPELQIPKVLKVLNSGADLDNVTDGLLSQPWVLKSTHGSGDVLVKRFGCSDRLMLRKKVQAMLGREHGRVHYEWGYFDVPKRVFFEEYIQSNNKLCELKIYTFGQCIGRVVHIGGRFGELWANAWTLTDNGRLARSEEPATLAPAKEGEPLPKTTPEMLRLAKILGKDFDHMRVDLLTDGEQIWFGELTIYSQAGYHTTPSSYSRTFGMTTLWDLRKSYFFNQKQHGWAYGLYQALLIKNMREANSKSVSKRLLS